MDDPVEEAEDAPEIEEAVSDADIVSGWGFYFRDVPGALGKGRDDSKVVARKLSMLTVRR